jgi:hypothetical protein
LSDAAVEIVMETSNYFQQASQQLIMPAKQRHSIVPKRHSTMAQLDEYDDNDDDDNTSYVISDEVKIHRPAHFLAAVSNSVVPKSSDFCRLSARSRSSFQSLRTLTRMTSQEFGTTSVRPHVRTPSLLFNPPFIKADKEH